MQFGFRPGRGTIDTIFVVDRCMTNMLMNERNSAGTRDGVHTCSR